MVIFKIKYYIEIYYNHLPHRPRPCDLCQRRNIELGNEPIADEHCGFLAASLGALADYLRERLQSLLKALHPLWVTAVLLTPAFVPGIDSGGQFLCGRIFNQIIFKEERHSIAVMLVSVGSVLYGFRKKQSLVSQPLVSFQ